LSDDKLMVLLGLDKAKFRKPVFPGDQLRLEVELISLRPRSVKAKGKAFVEGTLVAEAEMFTMIVDRAQVGEGD